MRGELTLQKLEEINAKLPTLDERFLLATAQGPGVDINDLFKDTRLGVALVCLEDAGQRFNLVRSALHEAFACLEWYRNSSPKAPQEMEAVLTGKFYADYAPLLLYAAGEDIAAFVVNFLGINDELNSYLQDPRNEQRLKRMKVSSNAAKIGIFMSSKYPDDEITKVIIPLSKNPYWKEAMIYRNTWVHEQPPIVHGLGIQYNRQSRVSQDGMSISFGGGSDPKYTVDKLIEIVKSAMEAFLKVISSLLDIVIKRREDLGERLFFDSTE